MSLFKCKAEKLAKYLAENPGLYNSGVAFFNGVRSKKILSPEVEKDLGSDLRLFKRAFDISVRSEWFAFNVYDAWAERTEENSTGVELYQKVGNDLVVKLGLDSNGVSTEENAVDFLNKRKVKRVFTLTPGDNGYCGVPYLCGEGKDLIKREKMSEFQVSLFRDNDIKVVALNYLVPSL